MASCKDCIHEKVCLHRANIQTDTYAYMGVKYDTERCKHFKSTADVVPRAEYEAAIIDRNAARFGMIVEHERLMSARAVVAREIFEEIYKVMNSLYLAVQHSCVGMHGDNPETMRLIGKLEGVTHLGDEIAKLKKEYTEEG